jgi:Caspase domain
MYKFTCVSFFLFHISLSLIAQNLSLKTNEFLINKSVMPDTGPLPRILWIHPQTDFTSSASNKMEVHATVQLSGSAKEIKVTVGSSTETNLVYATKKIKVEDGKKLYDITLPITMPDGSNYIAIDVTTTQDVVVSDKRKILIGKGILDNVLSLDRKDYALLFATDKYDYWNDLVNPIDDVRAIAKELKEKYNFSIEIVENPNVEEIWKKLREYNERKFSPQDQLLVFFAGHGHYDETFGEGYVVAKNSLQNDLSRNTYLSHNRLRGVISNIKCNHILLTMDVCFGGTLDPVVARSRGGSKLNEASTNEILARKWGHKTRKYLTSGGKEYVSDGIPGKHSPFSERLIESFRSLGGDDRILTLAEIQVELEKIKLLPRTGSFGDDEPLSDFVFVGKR